VVAFHVLFTQFWHNKRMTEKAPKHRSYLLRMWEEDSQIESPWRIVVVDPHTGERWGFTQPEHLLGFLKEQMDKDSTGSSTDQAE